MDKHTIQTEDIPVSINSQYKLFAKVIGILFPVLCFGGLGVGAITLVSDQLIYHKLGGDLNPSNKSYHCGNTSVHNTTKEHVIQEHATTFRLFMKIASCATGLLFLPFWGAFSDRYGRYISFIASALGALCLTTSYLFVLHIKNMPLWILIIAEVLHGIFGQSSELFITTSAAFIADVIPRGKRTLVMISMELLLLVSTTISEVVSGYWIRSSGFTQLVITMVVLQLSLMLYSATVISKFRKNQSPQNDTEMGICKAVPRYFLRTYQSYLKKRLKNTRACLLILMCVLLLQHVAYFGNESVQAIYLLGPPLCWNSVKLSVFSGVKIGVYSVMPFVIGIVCIKSGPSVWLIMASLISGTAGNVVFGFSTTTYMMYIGLCVGCISILITSVGRALISDMVHPKEQGAAMAGYAIISIMAKLAGTSQSTAVYRQTIVSYSSTFYFLGAGILFIAAAIFCIFIYIYKKDSTIEEERRFLIDHEKQ